MIWQRDVSITGPVALFQNKLTGAASVQSTPFVPGFPPANVLSETTYDEWVANGGNDAYPQIIMGAPTSVDSFAIVGHNLGSLGARVRFGWRFVGSGSFAYSPNMYPTDNGPILYCGPRLQDIERFIVRADLYASGNAIISSFWAGDRLEIPSSVAPEYVRAADAVTVEGEAAISRGGHYLGATMRRRGGRLPVTLNPIARAWADSNLPAFRDHYDKRRPFFFASSPSVYPDDVVYGWRGENAGELRPTINGGGGYVRFGMELDFHAA